MPLAILAFVFGALLFLMSAAALALEPGPWRLAVLALALLHAGSGFLAVGGADAYANRRWREVASRAAVGAAATTIAALAAFHLAAACRIDLSQHAAMLIIVATLAAGVASIVLVFLHARKHPTEA